MILSQLIEEQCQHQSERDECFARDWHAHREPALCQEKMSNLSLKRSTRSRRAQSRIDACVHSGGALKNRLALPADAWVVADYIDQLAEAGYAFPIFDETCRAIFRSHYLWGENVFHTHELVPGDSRQQETKPRRTNHGIRRQKQAGNLQVRRKLPDAQRVRCRSTCSWSVLGPRKMQSRADSKTFPATIRTSPIRMAARARGRSMYTRQTLPSNKPRFGTRLRTSGRPWLPTVWLQLSRHDGNPTMTRKAGRPAPLPKRSE